MKKTVALSFTILTIFICGWLIVDQIKFLDIVPNYTDMYASLDKQKIDERTDIGENEKKILRNQVDQNRAYKTQISNDAFKIQVVLFGVVIIQILLIFVILMMPKLVKEQKSKNFEEV